jgi:hypothetical protein
MDFTSKYPIFLRENVLSRKNRSNRKLRENGILTGKDQSGQARKIAVEINFNLKQIFL